MVSCYLQSLEANTVGSGINQMHRTLSDTEMSALFSQTMNSSLIS